MKQLLFFLALLPFINLSQNTAEPFLPELIKTFPNVRDIAISPNGNEVMFTAQSVMGNLSAIVYTKKENDIWSSPEIASFSGQYFDLEPFYSHDGLKLYFISTRPLDDNSSEPKDHDIWFVERKTLDSNWSQAINLGSPINTVHSEFYPSISENGNFYFTRDNPTLNRKDDIYVSKYINGKYTIPEVLPETINSDGYEYNAFIAPDESYLLYGCYVRKDGLGSGDIYISFKTENGWSKAKNLGNIINTPKFDYCPFVDINTNTLYFTSKKDNTVIKNQKPLTTKSFIEELHKYDNGSSRLYKISLSKILKKD